MTAKDRNCNSYVLRFFKGDLSRFILYNLFRSFGLALRGDIYFLSQYCGVQARGLNYVVRQDVDGRSYRVRQLPLLGNGVTDRMKGRNGGDTIFRRELQLGEIRR